MYIFLQMKHKAERRHSAVTLCLFSALAESDSYIPGTALRYKFDIIDKSTKPIVC